jgi:hypothetical protein
MRGYGPTGTKMRNGGDKPQADVRMTGKGCEVLRKEAKAPSITSPTKRSSRSMGKR